MGRKVHIFGISSLGVQSLQTNTIYLSILLLMRLKEATRRNDVIIRKANFYNYFARIVLQVNNLQYMFILSLH